LLQQLAELYPDASDHPDWHGTIIRSGFDDHIVFWNCNQFKKPFMTALSDFPECLFNSGYSQLEAFSTTISKFYGNKSCWALASKEKVDELAMLEDSGAIVTIGENEISMDILLMLTNLVSFSKDMRLKYNNCKGT
jgi:hypothetical protein